jgi:hypothetical protein
MRTWFTIARKSVFFMFFIMWMNDEEIKLVNPYRHNQQSLANPPLASIVPILHYTRPISKTTTVSSTTATTVHPPPTAWNFDLTAWSKLEPKQFETLSLYDLDTTPPNHTTKPHHQPNQILGKISKIQKTAQIT